MTAFFTICAFTRPRISVRKSSRRSLQRMPPRAMRPLRRCTPSTRGEHTQISNIGRGSGRSGTFDGSNLKASTSRCAGVGAGAERVGAHRGVDRAPAGRAACGRRRGWAPRRAPRAPRAVRRRSAARSGPSPAGSKRSVNSPTSCAAMRRVAGQRGLDVLLAEREADLAQVARVGAQHLHLAGGEPGEQHEPVEPVDLDGVGELGDEGALHLGARLVGRARRPSGTSTPTSCSHTPCSPSAKWNARSSMARKPSWSSSGSRSAMGTAAPRWYTRNRHWCGRGLAEVHHRRRHVTVGAAVGRAVDDGQVDGRLFGQFSSS